MTRRPSELSPAERMEIGGYYDAGIPTEEIAQTFGISRAGVSYVAVAMGCAPRRARAATDVAAPTVETPVQPSGAIVPFSFEGAPVRAVLIDGEPHLVGKDVCERLGYANATDAMNKHCKGVAKRYPLQTAGGMQEVRVLSEPDVLRLIVSSKLPAAERFERWLFEDVLPAIRKTGGYGAPAGLATREELERTAARLESKIDQVLSGYDQRRVTVVQYRTMPSILDEHKVPQQNRRGFGKTCFNSLLRFAVNEKSAAHDGAAGAVQVSAETGHYVFHVDTISRWLAHAGTQMIRDYLSRISGQGALTLVVNRKHRQDTRKTN